MSSSHAHSDEKIPDSDPPLPTEADESIIPEPVETQPEAAESKSSSKPNNSAATHFFSNSSTSHSNSSSSSAASSSSSVPPLPPRSERLTISLSSAPMTVAAPRSTIVRPLVSPTFHAQVYLFGGETSNGAILNSVEFYDTTTKVWNYTEPMPMRLSRSSVVHMSGRFFLLGGMYETETASDKMLAFDPVQREWIENLPSMNFRRISCCSVVWRERIFVFGGSVPGLLFGVQPTNSCEMFDIKSQVWKIIPAMKAKRGGAAAAVINDKIYVYGGVGSHSAQNTGECFDPITGKWSDIPSLTELRDGFSGCSLFDRFYIFGGTTRPSCERFEPKSRNVKRIADCDGPRINASATVVGTRIFLVAGRVSEEEYDDTAVSYDPTADTFFKVPGKINQKRCLAVASTIILKA